VKDSIPQRVSAEKCRARQLSRILTSEHFARSERLSRFLGITVEQTWLAGPKLLRNTPSARVFGRKD